MSEEFHEWYKRVEGCDYTVPRNLAEILWVELQHTIAEQNRTIADLRTRLSGQTCYVPPEFQAELTASQEQVKMLREVLHSCVMAGEDEDDNKWYKAMDDAVQALEATAPAADTKED